MSTEPYNNQRIGTKRKRAIKAMRLLFGHCMALYDIENAVDEAILEWIIGDRNGTIKAEEKRLAYICRTANNKLLNLLRHRKLERPMSDVTWEPDALDGAEVERDAKGDVNFIFSQMPERWRNIFALLELDNYSVSEVADMLHTTEKAIRRVKEKAQERFEELGIKLLGYPPRTKRTPAFSRRGQGVVKNKSKKS